LSEGVEAHDVVILEQKEAQNNRLILNTLRMLEWKPLLTVPFRHGSAGKIWEWLRLRASLRKLQRVVRVYIGNYAAGMAAAAANIFPDAEHYLLDDGTSTINFPAFRYAGQRPEHLPPARSLSLVGYRPELPREITFFSIYNLAVRSPDKLRPNELGFLRDAVCFNPNGPVFFIGSCMPDVSVIGFDQFFQLFRAAREWLGRSEVVYFPHRRELLDRKRDFFRELGVRVAHPELPFELELIQAAVKPSAIATFYSTALDTLRIINRGQEGRLLAFHLPESWVQTDSHRRIASTSYADYRQSREVRVVNCLSTPVPHYSRT